MYYGGGSKTQVNNQSQPLPHAFVSLTLKGRTDGFMLKGGDATHGTQAVMYNGSRPFEPDNTPPAAATAAHSRLRSAAGEQASGTSVSLQTCAVGNKKQLWAFEKNGVSIASGGSCLDIEHFQKTKGSGVWAYPCGGSNSKDNEFWALGSGTSTIQSLQHGTPFCLGIKNGGTKLGAEAALDSCSAPSAAFTIGFTNASTSSGGTIMQKSSGLCLTVSDFPRPPSPHGHGGRCECRPSFPVSVWRKRIRHCELDLTLPELPCTLHPCFLPLALNSV